MKKHLLTSLILFVITTSICHAQSPILWGTSSRAGLNELGTLFQFNTSNNTITTKHSFGMDTDGKYPGSIIQARNGLIYGWTDMGGANDSGMLYNYDISTGIETDIYDFEPYLYDFTAFPDGLIQASNGLLYGTASGYGFAGTLFSFNIFTAQEINLHYFGADTDGYSPSTYLIQANNGLLYGMTGFGGDYDEGTIYSFDTATNIETVVHSFYGDTVDGRSPFGSLIQASNGLLYGMTYAGGGYYDEGTIFSFNISTGEDSILHNFGVGNDGWAPNGHLTQVNDSLLFGLTANGGTNNSGVLFNYNINTGKETVLYDFGNDSEGGVYGSLTLASNGLLYGMTDGGGTDSNGVIFSYAISTKQKTDLYNFTDSYGQTHFEDLIEIDTPFTGINNIKINTSQLSIYPNPTSGQFTIKAIGNQNGYTVAIYNLLGEEVYHSAGKSLLGDLGVINLTSQPTGIYFVYLKSDEGVEVGKVLVTK